MWTMMVVTDYTRRLGEIMGQSPAEREAAAQAAAEQAAQAIMPPANADSNADAAQQTPPPADTAQQTGDTAGAHDAANHALTPGAADTAGQSGDHAIAGVHAVSHAAHHGPDLSAYAFPFSSHEVFGLLPGSIGGKVESLWQYAQGFADATSSFTMTITSLVILAIAIAFISTIRVWRRGPEVAVAGFGDHLTLTGARYKVRQEAPRKGARQPLLKTAEPAAEALPSTDNQAAANAALDAALTAIRETPEVEALPAAAAPALAPERKSAPKPGKIIGRKGEAKPKFDIPITRTAKGKPAAKAEAPEAPAPEAPPAASEEAQAAEIVALLPAAAPGPQVSEEPTPAAAAPDAAKKPKSVRRQLFKRSATSHSFAGQLHGSYGTYDAQGKLFAGDYLRQTNEAFEAAHLKGKGPRLSGLRLSDSHRAERLFMMATRTAGDDPSTALAALWQAVEEDSADAVAWLRLAHCYLELGDAERAARILEPLQEQAEKANLPAIVAAAANSRGKIAAKKGDADAARKLLATAYAAGQQSDNPFLAGISAANLGLVEAAKGKLEPAKDHLVRGIKSLDAAGEHVSAAQFRMALGTVLKGMGHNKDAEHVWTEAAEALRAHKLTAEAETCERWLKGEEAPSKVTL